MTRGDIVTVALQGDFGKPRPAIVVQSDIFNPTHPSITVLPVTSTLQDAPAFRLTIDPTPENGLRTRSQIMVDKAHTVRRDRLGGVVGRIDNESLVLLDRAIALWFGLA